MAEEKSLKLLLLVNKEEQLFLENHLEIDLLLKLQAIIIIARTTTNCSKINTLSLFLESSQHR